ncbi:MAG: YdcF family protein [Vicinamibacterales bacterium]
MKLFFVPGSASFLLIVTTAALLMLRIPRLRRAARVLLATCVTAYWILSLPIVTDWIGGSLPRRLLPTAAAGTPHAIVVLGAGVSRFSDASGADTVPMEQTALNALEAAHLYQQTGPIPVVASGGCFDCSLETPESATLRKLLVDHGVPNDRIVEESTSNSTREQALDVAPILRAHGWNPVLLVTSPVHLLRASRAFAAVGIGVIPAPAAFHSDLWPFHRPFVPSFDALSTCEESIYDYISLPYYWARGWLRPATR